MYRPLIAGIDTLEIGYCVKSYSLSDDEWDLIRQAKESAQATLHEKGMAITLRGIDFEVQRIGSSRYKYIMANDDIQIKIFEDARAGTNFPELRIIFRSSYLWRKGWKDAVKIADAWIQTWAVITEIKISRIDVMVDFAGILPTFTPELKEIVTRCKNKTEFGLYTRHTEGKQSTGFNFGSGDLKCRIYDKTKEIIKSNKKWFEILWGKNGRNNNEPVTRVEFQCRRKIIRELQINNVDDIFIQIPDIWKYLTREWLTIRVISEDTHRTRWDISDFWKVVQNAVSIFGSITGVTRLKQVKPRYERLERQARGLVISMAALASVSMGQNDCHYGQMAIRERFKKWMKDPDFQTEVENRIKKYGVMKY